MVIHMKTIAHNIETEIEIQKSRFITIIKYITTKEEAKETILKAKEKYPNATHYTYAYILDSDMHVSDDGEPSGTAGNPMLNVLQKQDLHFTLAIVIRYFGGIKLGAGGLVRAYSGSVRNALMQTSIIELELGYKIQIIYDYQDSKRMNSILSKLEIKEKEFTETIRIIAIGNQKDLEYLKQNNIPYQIIEKLYIKKRTN